MDDSTHLRSPQNKRDAKPFLNIWMAGLAFVRCHELGEGVDNAARDTLAAMASFIGRDERHKLNPMCVAAQSAIAERAKLSVRAVADAQKRLADAGLVERVGQNGRGLSFTVKWRLTLLASSAPAAEERAPLSSAPPAEEQTTARGGSARAAEEHPAADAEERSAGGADNISSDLFRPQGREKRGRSDAADAAPSAGATGSAAAPSTEQGTSGLIAEVMTARGGSQRDAEAYIARTINKASSLVQNETKYIRASLAREAATANAPSAKSKGKGSAKAGKARGAGQARKATAPGVKRPAHVVRKAQVAEAVAASRGGESVDLLAERLHVTPVAVDRCRREHDTADAREAVLAGESPEDAVARFPRGDWDADGLRGWLQRHHEREQRRADAEALRAQRLRDDEQQRADADALREQRRRDDEKRRAAADALRREWDEHFATVARGEKTEQWA